MNSVHILEATVSRSNIVAAVAAQLQSFGKVKEIDVEDITFGDLDAPTVQIKIYYKEVITTEGNGKN